MITYSKKEKCRFCGSVVVVLIVLRITSQKWNSLANCKRPSKRVTPTKARLCKKANDWKWSSANFNWRVNRATPILESANKKGYRPILAGRVNGFICKWFENLPNNASLQTNREHAFNQFLFNSVETNHSFYLAHRFDLVVWDHRRKRCQEKRCQEKRCQECSVENLSNDVDDHDVVCQSDEQ